MIWVAMPSLQSSAILSLAFPEDAPEPAAVMLSAAFGTAHFPMVLAARLEVDSEILCHGVGGHADGSGSDCLGAVKGR